MTKRNIVVIEDDPATLELIRLNLEQAGLKVHVASDGLSGLALIRKQCPDGVVLDIKVPKMNGYEICTTMQSDEALKSIPIMVITGLTDSTSAAEDEKWRERLSVADFISKPFQPLEFTERVVKMVAAMQ
jgi:CheY-like chemotaxis protein